MGIPASRVPRANSNMTGAEVFNQPKVRMSKQASVSIFQEKDAAVLKAWDNKSYRSFGSGDEDDLNDE